MIRIRILIIIGFLLFVNACGNVELPDKEPDIQKEVVFIEKLLQHPLQLDSIIVASEYHCKNRNINWIIDEKTKIIIEDNNFEYAGDTLVYYQSSSYDMNEKVAGRIDKIKILRIVYDYQFSSICFEFEKTKSGYCLNNITQGGLIDYHQYNTVE